jgi:hypothetical protein
VSEQNGFRKFHPGDKGNPKSTASGSAFLFFLVDKVWPNMGKTIDLPYPHI